MLVSASLDRRLSPWERLTVRAHLFICKGCTHFSRQMNILRAATRQLAEGGEPDEALPAGLPDEARRRIRDTLREHHHPGDDHD